jgi:hypothetical protein
VRGKDANVNIVVFEEKEKVGGRMVLSYDDWIGRLGTQIKAENVAGGQLGTNLLAERARAVLGFDFGKKEVEGKVKEVGFFDGRSFVSKVTRPSGKMSWGMWLGLVWRYGASVWRARDLPQGTMSDFKGLLKGEKTFESVSEMVEEAEIDGAVGIGASERLKLNGINEKYVDEVMGPQVWRQTGQSVGELSDLAISMALEREDQMSGGTGGSFETVLERFVERSKADLRFNTKVTGLKREMVDAGKDAWILELKRSGDHQPTYDSFDKVILAGPWNTISLRKDETLKYEAVYYRSLCVTFLVSSQKLRPEYFGSTGQLPSQMLPIPSANLPSELENVHEISHVADIFGPDITSQSVRGLYRILSNHSISAETISGFVEEGTSKFFQETIQNAYPLTWPREGSFGSFKVQEELWHTGVVEGIGSSVDLSWVAGENVGRLVAREVGKNKP